MQDVKPSASALNYSKLKTKIHNIYIFLSTLSNAFITVLVLFLIENIFLYIFLMGEMEHCAL